MNLLNLYMKNIAIHVTHFETTTHLLGKKCRFGVMKIYLTIQNESFFPQNQQMWSLDILRRLDILKHSVTEIIIMHYAKQSDAKYTV